MPNTIDRMLERLPTLYRPEPEDIGLLTMFLKAIANCLDELENDSVLTLQARWFDYADRAKFSPYFLQSAHLRKPPSSTKDQEEQASNPYIHDLAYLAALLPLPPGQEPPLKETVENYRRRIRNIVNLYREGLGTLGALRRMIEATLIFDLPTPGALDRPFWIEEFAPLSETVKKIQVISEPESDDLVGPLMRWSVTNSSLESAPLTVYLTGLDPGQNPRPVQPAQNPLIELFQVGSTKPQLALLYRGTLAGEETLRLRPAFYSYLGLELGLAQAQSLPDDTHPADPTAPGPWIIFGPWKPGPLLPPNIHPPDLTPPSASRPDYPSSDTASANQPFLASGLPEHSLPDSFQPIPPITPGPLPIDENPPGAVRALLVTEDHTLWVAAEGQLWRYNGHSWMLVLKDLPQIHCLTEDKDLHQLLMGTEKGLLKLPLYPIVDNHYEPSPKPSELTGSPIYTIQCVDDRFWVGGRDGVAQLEDFIEGKYILAGAAVYSIYADLGGTIFFGGKQGLYEYRQSSQRWYYYQGKNFSEQPGDWVEFNPSAEIPLESDVYLPPIYSIMRDPDASLWLATEKGLARYCAISEGGPNYQTLLQAFPELTTQPIYVAAQDERGLAWFGGQDGLFRFDGRDFWQYQKGDWKLLGLLRQVINTAGRKAARGAWRFSRAMNEWQQYDTASKNWMTVTYKPVGQPQDAVRCLAWCDGVLAESGSWNPNADNSAFTLQAAVNPELLSMRLNLNLTRIVNGGIPALPRLPAGDSIWRYLSLETPENLPQSPGFTSEGRLLAPDDFVFDNSNGAELGIPGRFEEFYPLPDVQFDYAVYPYLPAARVWFSWQIRQPHTALVRLKARSKKEKLDPVLIDRIWQGMQLVRPAGVKLALAIEEEIIRR